MKHRKILLLSSVIFIAALSRFLAPWPNVTPLGAMALLGGAYFQRKWLAMLLPLAALWISDLVFNNLIYKSQMIFNSGSEGFVWFGESFLWVGGSMILITLLGSSLLQNRTVLKMLGGSVLASILFFIITNFGVWASGIYYPMNVAGLLTTYIAGIPFFWNTLAGDLFFVFVLFGVVEYSLNKKLVFQLS